MPRLCSGSGIPYGLPILPGVILEHEEKLKTKSKKVMGVFLIFKGESDKKHFKQEQT